LPPNLLELELTESVLMGVSREHSDVLERLRQTGIKLAIDDFGTGYSSLEYLRRFRADRIKIAQVFVKELETKPDDAAIVKATIGLARELEVEVIAEGIETATQAQLISGWGCTEAQGFLFSRPLSVEVATAALTSGIVPYRMPI
jgi:EAL domain-containing protein (putative c-di-GMP-specific phosphodiesterase class I)